MSNGEEWWRPTSLPPSGYRLKSNEASEEANASFYPFSTELGYRVFKRLLEIERAADWEQEDNRVYKVKTIKQIDSESNHFYLKGLCSQNPTVEEEQKDRCTPFYRSDSDDRLVPSNYQSTSSSNQTISEEFHLNLRCDIDFDDF
ncbi:unnamed protein product [Trichobilharzia szidati]|nr:unnamed protein product [Trichobilharzia szidati]